MQHWLRHSKLNPTRTALQMTTQPNAALQQLASPSRVLGRLEIVRFRRGERNKMTSEEFNQVSQKTKTILHTKSCKNQASEPICRSDYSINRIKIECQTETQMRQETTVTCKSRKMCVLLLSMSSCDEEIRTSKSSCKPESFVHGAWQNRHK